MTTAIAIVLLLAGFWIGFQTALYLKRRSTERPAPQKTYTKAEFLAAINELPDFTVEWKHTGNVMGQIMTAKFLLKKAI